MDTLDLALCILYMAGVLGVGWACGRRQRDLRDYFLGGRSVPWAAVLASIVATETSTVTFISVPAFAFAANSRGEGGNFTFLSFVLGSLLGRLVVLGCLLPAYFRGELLTVYQLLEQRFNRTVRQTASVLFLITRSLADGVRLMATALVLVALVPWSEFTAILALGAVTVLYTWMGGMRAVIWTDVIQWAVYLVGATTAAVLLWQGIPGGWATVVAVGHEQGKFQVFDFTLDLARSYTFWAGVVGGAFLTTATHGTDQLMVQRYLCARSLRQAAVALLGSGVAVFLQFGLFLGIGLLLFVFYQQAGSLPAEVAQRPDRVFPHFVATALPAGVKGLVVAAVFAAAMSTLSSSLNSLAAASVSDFYRAWNPGRMNTRAELTISQWLTLAWGLVQMAVAWSATHLAERVVDTVLALASFTNGPVLGLFLLGLFTRRVDSFGALTGLAAGLMGVATLWSTGKVSWQWYVVAGAVLTAGAGWAVAGWRTARAQRTPLGPAARH